jgi:hypothetical protein
MNFYASREFLDAAAAVYYPGRSTSIENVQIGDDILRLLVVDGRAISKLQFLDYHQPLIPAEIDGPVRQGRYARAVVRGTIEAAAWSPTAFPPFGLAPYVDWSAFPNFESYRDWLLTRHRRLIRERERRWRGMASAHGPILFTADDRGEDVLAAARAWKSRQLCLSGHRDWMEGPGTMAFLGALRAGGHLVSSTLRVGGEVVAVWTGFHHEGAWSGWIFAFDPGFSKYSPGHRLLFSLLEESKNRGDREFDFAEGAEHYKFDYATHGRLLGEVGRPPLARMAVVTAKRALQQVGLLTAAQDLKRRLDTALRRKAPLPEGA